ncbi:hypothetical protein D3877_12000 [Azospirillum cavernae]|uniref:Uncharacterized protein n=1 Tax=Azospirillum cavernae TaxID=2320860 RepID=A0A418VUW1_9PROT|nr:hypothetical protein [Azospirillum cavernae]RJF80951.1 hypothetical protein D3877_12000 [Azospirillum cavernae]
MSNDYFTHENPEARRTVARAESVNGTFQAIEAGFDKLPAEGQVKRGTVSYGADSGIANAYRVTLPYPPTSYTEGMEVSFRVGVGNSAASTVDLYGASGALLGVKPIRRQDGGDTVVGDMPTGSMTTLRYDGSTFRIVSVGAMITKPQLDAAIANAVLPVGSGQVKITGNDAVGQYLDGAVAVTAPMTKTIQNPGADEALLLGIDPLAITNLSAGLRATIERAARRSSIAFDGAKL